MSSSSVGLALARTVSLDTGRFIYTEHSSAVLRGASDL